MTDTDRTQRLSEIRAREQAATPGPWRWDLPSDSQFRREIGSLVGRDADDSQETWICHFGEVDCCGNTEGRPPDDEDCAFIANSRADIPFLLAEVERLQAELDGARALADEELAPSVPSDDVENTRLDQIRAHWAAVRKSWSDAQGDALTLLAEVERLTEANACMEREANEKVERLEDTIRLTNLSKASALDALERAQVENAVLRRAVERLQAPPTLTYATGGNEQ